MEVSTEQLANCLGITTRRVQLLAKESVVLKLRRGTYDLEKSVQGYIAYKLESLEQSQEQKSLDEIRGDHERWKMRKTQLAVRLMEGKLHRAEDVERVWTQSAAAVRSRLLGIPVKAAPQVAGMEDAGEVQKILQREVAEALNEIAAYDPADFADPLPLEDEEEEDDSQEESGI